MHAQHLSSILYRFPRKNREMCSKYVTFYANRERVKELWQAERNYGMALADVVDRHAK
jgi:hypothetical protein